MKLPPSWQLPSTIKNRLGQKSAGKQRAMIAEGHLLLVLHRAPTLGEKQRQGVFFWRDPQGKWECSAGGVGLKPLMKHIQVYEEAENVLSLAYGEAEQAEDYFNLLEQLAPLQHSTQNLHNTLQAAREGIPEDRDIIDLRDWAYGIERSLNLLHENIKNSLDYRIAERVEQQNAIALESVRASHRLNILVAIFFPLTAITCIFGMNLNSGLAESFSFWLILLISLTLGFWVRRWVIVGRLW
ncbi:CorA family divalent cation transporter [Spirulina subsalsa FACHB-351]|uniref:CorA family divalent cation transporter n=1 Tax=Spirulina subsalsa FACHB-351 TaxID=234711 RepID=A0ABT3L478_9CYAN|nr:CorA family divalent cation transporter [Spirulina subsalsa]MCW6036307.1 CorA family divalent cation transporter [Spirulina subsalsa FACHB-351]